MDNSKHINSISDFSDYKVTCTYQGKSIQVTDPLYVDIIKKAVKIYKEKEHKEKMNNQLTVIRS